MNNILTITGSDNSGWAGLQLDLRIIEEMGGHALTTATCIVMQCHNQIKQVVNFPDTVIQQQVEHIMSHFHPRVVKVGLLRSPEAVKAVAHEIVGCPQILVAPGAISSLGVQLIDAETLWAIKTYLIPLATLLVLRQSEAEALLGSPIRNEKEMELAAQNLTHLGAQYVMIRGGRTTQNRITALLYGPDVKQFFSSYNIEGWQQHGVGGALTAAIATRLGMADSVPQAISNAHQFVHSRIVYSVNHNSRKLRPADVYNEFMSLLAGNYRVAHQVQFYADRLCISTRYLSKITHLTVQKTPKQIVAEYLLYQSCQLLENSRMSVKEIAHHLGFASTALFCTFFKLNRGVTPSQYRK